MAQVIAENVFDTYSDDGELLNRGYLELALNEQHCEGASDEGHATLVLSVLDKKTKATRDTHVFKTMITNDVSKEQRKALLTKLMDRLTGKHGVSAFTAPGEIDPDALQAFTDDVRYASASWVD